MSTSKSPESRHFLNDIIDADLAAGRVETVVTRFPPEPNGFLHIGHVKAISVDFGLAEEYGGRCHLRMDDTNPAKEDVRYVEAIQKDIHWLGYDWGEHMYYASDYFERLYQFAEELIEKGLAYVDESSEEEIRSARGSLSEPGRPSPYRHRSVAENLSRFREMRAGEHPDGSMVLRAKIDMASPNMKMRDPLLYRIRRGVHHYRTGDAWCIYPMYDFAHCLSDALEGVTHSICTLEFENNRELYDWIVEAVDTEARPHQYEFARLKLDYTVMSKRKLAQLVSEGRVSGWDDPRMPTIAGLRRRGYTPEALRAFCERLGVAKANTVVDIGKLEFAIRDDLNHRAPRVMAVISPLEVELTNVGEGDRIEVTAPLYPADIGKPGERALRLGRRLFIDADDFSESPPPGFRRLTPGGEVRLRHGYVIRCDEVVKDGEGKVTRLRCSADLDTLGKAPAGRKVSGVIHWVDAESALDAEIRLYDRLFTVPQPDSAGDFMAHLNPESLIVARAAKVEASVANDDPETRYQFERLGYFVRDADSREGALVFNRVVGLRDSWARERVAAPGAEAGRSAGAVAGRDSAGKSARAATRPKSKSRAEYRQIARERNPALAASFERWQRAFDVSESDADVLSGDADVAAFFDAAVASWPGAESGAQAREGATEVAKWVVNEVLREIKETPITALPLSPRALARLAYLAAHKRVSSAIAREVFGILMAEGGDPDAIIDERGLKSVSDTDALQPIVDRVLADNAAQVEAYRGGKTALMGFFVGQVMKATGGKADPAVVRELLTRAL